jgi:hypothetical protein
MRRWQVNVETSSGYDWFGHGTGMPHHSSGRLQANIAERLHYTKSDFFESNPYLYSAQVLQLGTQQLTAL